ncbi:MAG: BLUF domain-containing protein [Sphingomonadaceae bacterium]|jgi:hypothetical protein
MHRLLYTSQACFPDGLDPESEVRRLASKAAEFNQACGVTGALLYVEGTFIQVLEGRFAYLEDTFERICCDFRHEKLRLLDLVPVDGRLFYGWSMACLTVEGAREVRLKSQIQEVRSLVGVNARDAVKGIQALLKEQEPARIAA